MKRNTVILMAAAVALLASPCFAASDSPQVDEVHKLEGIVIMEKAEVPEEKTGAPGLKITPAKTVIDLEKFKTIGPQTSVIDVLKTQAVIDFRGDNSLDPGVDSIFLRGFDATRFVVAIDGLTLQKTGGRKSTNIVDYSLLPTFLIKEIEILPGPHSALYDSKSIGGVINMITVKPERKESLKPDITETVGFGSYNTFNNTTTIQGAVEDLTYDLAYNYYDTDGYLRNSATSIETLYARLGYILPADGFVTLSGSSTKTDRQAPVNNPGASGDFDNDYPITSGGLFAPYSRPTWDGDSWAYRLNAEQASPIGKLNLSAYTAKDNRVRAYYATPTDTALTVMDTDWWEEGLKIQDEYKWAKNHSTIVGFDFTRLYDDGIDNDKDERINKKGGYLQHTWGILPSLDAQLGIRYEDVKIWVTNSGVPGRPAVVERDWNQFMPKSLFTWKMNGLAPWLRDTSLSVGISKIWRAPDNHGDYDPQGKPAGFYLEPEHGMGYDLILNRRLWKDISIKFDYSFYDIDDYIVSNSSFAQHLGGNDPLRYSDYSINLKEVYRHGIDINLGGHIADQLSFNLSYSWQHFENQGDEPAGQTELGQRAAHRLCAGLKYDLFPTTALMLNYTYQSDEIIKISEEVAPDVWDFRDVKNDAYQTVDFSVQQKLYSGKGVLRDATVTVYVKNIFDEEYFDTTGFPATGRFFGTTLTMKF